MGSVGRARFRSLGSFFQFITKFAEPLHPSFVTSEFQRGEGAKFSTLKEAGQVIKKVVHLYDSIVEVFGVHPREYRRCFG